MLESLHGNQLMKVLIVEDSPTYQRVHRHFIEEGGDDVVTVDCAESALKLLATHEFEDIDVVLMDVHLPGINGFEATEIIKAHTKNMWLPVVFVSCSDSDEDYIRARKAGADAFLCKPMKAQQLRRCLDHIRHKQHDRLATHRHPSKLCSNHLA